jgi:DNA-binding response OmpR family regulator
VKGRRILIIEDDPNVAQILEVHLSRKGCNVLSAPNGEVGLQLMREQQVDLVLTDFMMPDLNGMEFVRALKNHPEWSQTRILFMSANTDPGCRQRAISLGAIDYLAKSAGAEAIVEKVIEYLGPIEGSSPEASISSTVSSRQRLERIELLTEQLMQVLESASMTDQLPDPASSALRSARQLAQEIGNAARGG